MRIRWGRLKQNLAHSSYAQWKGIASAIGIDDGHDGSPEGCLGQSWEGLLEQEDFRGEAL